MSEQPLNSEAANEEDVVAESVDEPTPSDTPIKAAAALTKQNVVATFESEESKFDVEFRKNISVVDSKEAGRVNKIDISPENGTSKAIIFLAPGWLETLDTNKYLIRSLVEFGYRVVSLEHPRDGGDSVNAEERHLSAISAVVNDTDLNGGKMFGMASSLGAIDISQFADPKRNPDTHDKFKDFILLNPAGLNAKKMTKVGDIMHLLKNYVVGHMRQGAEAKKMMSELEGYNGVPLTEIGALLREKMTKSGMADLNANMKLAFKEAVRVGGSKVQEELLRLRKNGHKVFVFSSEDDRLLPGNEYDAQVDQVIQLAGYHNTFRNATRTDYDNEQWMSLVWVNSLLEDLIAKG